VHRLWRQTLKQKQNNACQWFWCHCLLTYL